jgi:hypothetical protein
MPKRSNSFQRLIRRIYLSIQPKGATLTESALLEELETKTLREVDVLIELQVSGSMLRIAVECRDHARPADIQWIDALIGKYQRLAVDRVIAVSRFGFTASAVAKARANRIETRTLKAALDTDWPAELLHISVGRFVPILQITSTEIICKPDWPDGMPPAAVKVAGRDETPDEFMRSLTAQLHGPLWPLLESQVGKALGRPDDFNKQLTVQFDVDLANTVFVATAGSQHAVTKMRVQCDLTFDHELLRAERHLFGSVGVTSVTDSKAPQPITVVIAQEPGQPIGKPVAFAAKTGRDV